MTLNARNVPSGGKPQDPFDPGTYPSRTVQIIDLGLQPQTFNNEEKPPRNEIMLTYETVDEFMKDEEGNDREDKPRWISETFPLNSLNSERAKSTARYTALDPNLDHDGDWSKLLDIPCNVTIVNKPSSKDKKRINSYVGAVSAMRPRDAQKTKALVNKPKFFTMDDPDLEVFQSLPDWIQTKIKSGLEFGGSKLAQLLEEKGGTTKKSQPKQEEDEEEDSEKW